MKKYRFTILLPILLIITLALGAFSVSAESVTKRVYDKADILSDTEYESLEEKLADAEVRCGVSIRVYIDTTYYVNEDKMLSDLGMSYSSDLIVLSIEAVGGSYYYELFAYGDGDKYLSLDDSDEILDDGRVYSSIKSGAIMTGATAFADLTSVMLTENRVAAKNTHIFLTVMIPLATAAIVIAVIVYKYKKKLKSPIYPITDYASLNLGYSDDSFIGSHVSKTRIQSSSGRGGRGGGSGSRGRR